MLRINKLSKTYKTAGSRQTVLDGISFELHQGEALGILGRSGEGKSSLSRLLLGLEKADSGEILLDGQKVNFSSPACRKAYFRSVQLIFQDTAASFHPLHTIGESIAEAITGLRGPQNDVQLLVRKALLAAGLTEDAASRYPAQLSGGQVQRAAIARAVSCRPRFLICDEITSALDTLYQEQIISLLEKLRQQGTGLLFITHSPALMRRLCSRIIVLHQGSIAEEGPAAEVLLRPRSPFTVSLLSAAARLTLPHRQIDRRKE